MNESTVVHPLHDSAELERARSLWFAAEYSACLACLDRLSPTADGFLLSAWAHYRRRDYEAALKALACGDALFQSDEVRAEADAMSAVLHQIKGRNRESDAFADRAMASTRNGMFPRASNLLALRAWLRDDLVELFRQIRAGESCDDLNVRAYAVSLRAWAHGTRRQFLQQAPLLEQTLRLTLSAPAPDIGLAAETLQTLTELCRELYLPREFAAVEAALAQFPWTADLHAKQYNALRQAAWTYALQGQYVVGLRQLRKATALAPNAALSALSTLDAAWVALCSGEKNAAEAHFNDAMEILRDVEWERQAGDDVRTLLLAAEISCAFDIPQSRKLLSRYQACKSGLSVHTGAKHARNLDPIEDYAHALIEGANGNVGPARRLAKRAYREFAKMGYEWRASRCALFLYESGCGDTWLTAAREQAANYPRSFIGAQLERIRIESSSETLSRLTPRQRDVVRLLVKGDTVDDVAAALKTSPNTVRVHLKHIHRTLGVRNRVELLRAVKQSA
jgi:DNA-binding CsgD family transcriptional regulator/tetratricopeptide (TPR) repeat protein